jgi:hypothetical protein
MSSIVVCSFYTDDEYYRNEAKALKADLDKLGVDYVLEEIPKKPGQDWADMCRQKVPFLQSVCERFPDKKVFWIDVDCRLLSLPDFVRNSSADIIGFQRGFGSSLTIGYQNRTRFWEPCFWGVGTSENARKMIADAAALEATSILKATDDYFFEDGWRQNADSLTFQVIPSAAVVGKGDPSLTVESFFVFGSSGNVAEFKGKVEQHKSAAKLSTRKRIINLGKRVLKNLPKPVARRLINVADRIGVTAILTGQGSVGKTLSRRTITHKILRAGFDGNLTDLESFAEQLNTSGVTTNEERATVVAAKTFAHYSSRESEHAVTLTWWARPFPGNFGDWLSPLIIGNYTTDRILYHSPTAPIIEPHLISTGSIGRFITPSSIVVGTGISSDDVELHPKAEYISVRGPITAKLVKDCGGPDVDSFGDPGAIMSRIVPLTRAKKTNGKTAFVRHFTHNSLPMRLPDHFEELSVLMSAPDKIADFLGKLVQYDRVVTSAMHVFIVCQSYGIPCSLVTFEGFEDAVHGTGLKYGDYAMGVGLETISPVAVPLDLRKFSFANIERDDVVSEAKKDEIEAAIARSLRALESHR